MSLDDSEAVRITKSTAYKIIWKRSFRLICSLIIFSLLAYTLIAATIARYSFTNMGVIVVSTPKFEGGTPPEDSVILVDRLNSHELDFIGNLKNSFSPQPGIAKVKVIMGPYSDEMSFEKYGIDDDSITQLSNQYLVECLEGLCAEDNEFFIIDDKQIFGTPERIENV